MRCTDCSAQNPDYGRYCFACGAPLSSRLTGADTVAIDEQRDTSTSAPGEGRFPAGTVLAGRYRILGLLGRGGMGEVYRAHDLILNQAVALKFLLEAGHATEPALVRFRNEVRVARQVAHPNVCRVYDIGVVEGLNFLSMEYVDGEDLDSLLRRIGRISPDKALEIARRLCMGLAAAHERGVLHRDLKPANIMIDGRGHVRITDFGLAALANEVGAADIRSGTPAFMAPEQRRGAEVTVRSDIYSLGMVLYEMFTGKRRDDKRTTPTGHIRDLDPAIESVILKCLEDDPRHRPPSALAVAMALPGGDPMAAALAAGETPSPEMVAASQNREGLSPRAAAACFAGILLSVVVLSFLARYVFLTAVYPPALPPEALAFQAQQLLLQFGYTREPVDRGYGFAYGDLSYVQWLSQRETPERRRQWLATGQPALIRFWYRQSPRYLQTLGSTFPPGAISADSPPQSQPGDVRLVLDPRGRLVELSVLPDPAGEPGRAAPPDWNALLAAAGLEPALLRSETPAGVPPMFADSRMEWTGTYAPGRPEQLRIQAAAWQGRPVYFAILGNWSGAADSSFDPGVSGQVATAAILAALLAAGAIVAWRNVRQGRSDLRGARRVAAVLFVVPAVAWILMAHHVPGVWEFNLGAVGLSWALFVAGSVWLMYVAIEPYVRRHWPEALISWVRLLAGRTGDPLVASHLLAGAVAGIGAIVPHAAADALLRRFAQSPVLQPFPEAPTLNGIRNLGGTALVMLQDSVFLCGAFVLLIVLLRLGIGRTWIADPLFALLAATVLLNARPWPLHWAIDFVVCLCWIWLLRRFGLLAFVSSAFFAQIVPRLPVTINGFFAGQSFLVIGGVAAAAAWMMFAVLKNSSGPAGANRRIPATIVQ